MRTSGLRDLKSLLFFFLIKCASIQDCTRIHTFLDFAAFSFY